jgi:hypothetical protein
MKIIKRKTATKADDFLTSVARSIGSTLGTVVAKVNGSHRAARRRLAGRKRGRKHIAVSRTSRRTSAPMSKMNHKLAGPTRTNLKKSSR